MSNLHITRVGVEKKFGKKIPVHKIEKMFGKGHGIPVTDDFVTCQDFMTALRKLQKAAIQEMEEGSEVVGRNA